jgi:hypothetical protein
LKNETINGLGLDPRGIGEVRVDIKGIEMDLDENGGGFGKMTITGLPYRAAGECLASSLLGMGFGKTAYNVEEKTVTAEWMV